MSKKTKRLRKKGGSCFLSSGNTESNINKTDKSMPTVMPTVMPTTSSNVIYSNPDEFNNTYEASENTFNRNKKKIPSSSGVSSYNPFSSTSYSTPTVSTPPVSPLPVSPLPISPIPVSPSSVSNFKAISDRGNTLSSLNEKTNAMNKGANDFSEMARKLNEQQQNKKWYEFGGKSKKSIRRKTRRKIRRKTRRKIRRNTRR